MKNEVYYLSTIADILDRQLEAINNSLKSTSEQLHALAHRVENMLIDREAEYAKGVGQGGLEILEEKGKAEDSEG